MKKSDFQVVVSKSHLDSVFPFHFSFGKDFKIQFKGPSLTKLLGDIKGKSFKELFLIDWPRIDIPSYEELKSMLDQTFILYSKGERKMRFRGQFVSFEELNHIVFLGTPWFSSIEQVVENDLAISDFAPLDPMVDLLHLIKNQELAAEDLKHLIDTVNDQKKNLEKLSYVASANRNGILFTDQEGHITYANEGYLNQTGYKLKEIIGNTPLSLGHGPETDKEEVKKMLEAFYAKQPFKLELKHYRKNGSWFWCRLIGQLISDKSGKFLHYFTLLEDVTLEKESKEKVAAFEKTFRQVLEFSGDNVWEHDFRTEKTVFSNQVNNFLGLDFDEKTDLAKVWFQKIYPEDLPLVRENDRKYRSGEINSHQLEYRLFHADGSLKWVMDRGIVIEKDNNGLPLKIIGTHSDISHQKASEEELKDVNKKLGSVLNELKDVIWSVKYPTFETLFFTPSAEELFELDMDTLVNTTDWWGKVVHPEDIHVLDEIFEEVEKNKEYVKEYRLKTSSGKVKWIQNKGKLIYENGKPDRLNGILIDISERKKTEDLLEAQEKLKNVLIEISSTYINMDLLEVDQKIQSSLEQLGQFVNADRAYIFSYDFDSDTCSCTFEWCNEGVVSEFERIQKVPLHYLEKWVDSHQKGEPFRIRNVDELEGEEWEEIKGKLNKRGIKSLITLPMIQGKDLLGFVGFDSIKGHHEYTQKEIELLFVFTQMLVNVQKRQQFEALLYRQEEKFRNIISNMSLGLLEVDNEETVLHANQTFCDMVGYKLEEFIGSKATDLLLTEESKKVIFEKSASRKFGHTDSYELQYRMPNGELRWWLISGAPNYNDNGQLTGSIGIHLDITAQKKLEEELIRQREEAEKSKRAKELFFANMSHEIRTPMNAIVGMGEQLNKTALEPKQEKYLGVIQASAKHLMVVLKDILDLSKLEAGKMSIEGIGFKPKEVMERIIEMMGPKAEEKHLDFRISFFDPKINPVLIGDPYRINQILLNLLSNSIKFTEKGEVSLSCRLESDLSASQVLKIQVKDTGIGMDQAFISGNFEKYSQEDSSITRKYGGTGLGLSITSELLQLMGGRMEIESEKGIGTTISIFLPLQKGSEKDVLVEEVKSVDTSALQGCSILVVDDNEFNRMVAITILEQNGIKAETATNGKEALEIYEKGNFDLILMDVQMPVMDGIQATKIIREELKSEVPIVALTAFAMKGDEEHYLSKGMDSYLSKPFHEEDLLQVISRFINNDPVEIKSKKVKQAAKTRYSLEELEAIGKGNRSFVNKMLGLFIQNADEGIKGLQVLFDKSDFEGVRKLAHRIKPSVKMMKIHEISDEVRELEMEINNQGNSERMQYLINHILEVLQDVVIEIKENEYE